MRPDTAGDQVLVRAVLAGDRKAAEQLLHRIADGMWTACRLLTRDETDARDAFAGAVAAVQADGFRRLLAYDGRSRVETFVALITRDLLAQRVLRAFQEDPPRGWRVFESLFQADIRRLIFRRLPGPAHDDTRRDAYQEVCLALVDADYRRLRAYNGTGSFAGFVLHTVDRLLVDFIRGFSARRRAPAAIKRLPALEQAIFRLVYWEGAAPDAEALAAALAQRVVPVPVAADVAAALRRVRGAVPADYRSSSAGSPRVISLSEAPELAEDGSADGPAAPSPEEIAAEKETSRFLSIAAGVLREVAETLPEADRLYLRIALGGAEPLPAREVARLMQRPVEEVYKLRQRVLIRLKDALRDHEAVKKWRASV